MACCCAWNDSLNFLLWCFGLLYFTKVKDRSSAWIADRLLKLRGGADKSLAWPTSRCHKTESIMSLERSLFMCRIASLFLLQRLKGNMSGDARDSNNMETWTVIRFFFLQGKAQKEIHDILTETLGEHAPLYATIKNWVAQFKRGDFSTYEAPRLGRPKTVTTSEIIDQIHKLILEDRRISAKSIAEQLGISREWVGSIIQKDLDMWKLSAKWVLKCLNADQKCQWCQSSEPNFTIFSTRSKWFRVTIGDHGWNLVISLWSRDKATMNGVEA